ncbi:hypothetical protein H8E77_11330 [bacterium]|nr:hypothetical protein [bacterium]
MLKFISFILIIGFMIALGSENLIASETNDVEIHQSFQAFTSPKTYLLSATEVDTKEQRNAKPPLSVRNITNELISGTVGGICVGYYVGWFAGNIGYFTGYMLGSSSGVYRAGNMGNETGSFWATLGGSVLGGILGVGIILVTNHYELVSENVQSKAEIVSILSSPVIGATIGFNLTRKYK